jgi:hypothetical protein
MLLVKAVRRSRRGLRIAGWLILFGSVLHIAWLLMPSFEMQATVMVATAINVAMLLIVSLLVGRGLAPVLEVRRAQ